MAVLSTSDAAASSVSSSGVLANTLFAVSSCVRRVWALVRAFLLWCAATAFSLLWWFPAVILSKYGFLSSSTARSHFSPRSTTLLLGGPSLLLASVYAANASLAPFYTLMLRDYGFGWASVGLIVSATRFAGMIGGPLWCAAADYAAASNGAVSRSHPHSDPTPAPRGVEDATVGDAELMAATKAHQRSHSDTYRRFLAVLAGLGAVVFVTFGVFMCANSAPRTPSSPPSPDPLSSPTPIPSPSEPAMAVPMLLLALFAFVTSPKSALVDTIALSECSATAGGGAEAGDGGVERDGKHLFAGDVCGGESSVGDNVGGGDGPADGLCSVHGSAGDREEPVVVSVVAEDNTGSTLAKATHSPHEASAGAAYPLHRLWGSASWGGTSLLVGIALKWAAAPPRPLSGSGNGNKSPETFGFALPCAASSSALAIVGIHTAALALLSMVLWAGVRRARTAAGHHRATTALAAESHPSRPLETYTEDAGHCSRSVSAPSSLGTSPSVTPRSRHRIGDEAAPLSAILPSTEGSVVSRAHGVAVAVEVQPSPPPFHQKQQQRRGGPLLACLLSAPTAPFRLFAACSSFVLSLSASLLPAIAAAARQYKVIHSRLDVLMPIAVGVAAIGLAESIVGNVYFVYLREAFGASPLLFSCILCVNSASEMGGFWLASRLLSPSSSSSFCADGEGEGVGRGAVVHTTSRGNVFCATFQRAGRPSGFLPLPAIAAAAYVAKLLVYVLLTTGAGAPYQPIVASPRPSVAAAAARRGMSEAADTLSGFFDTSMPTTLFAFGAAEGPIAALGAAGPFVHYTVAPSTVFNGTADFGLKSTSTSAAVRGRVFAGSSGDGANGNGAAEAHGDDGPKGRTPWWILAAEPLHGIFFSFLWAGAVAHLTEVWRGGGTSSDAGLKTNVAEGGDVDGSPVDGGEVVGGAGGKEEGERAPLTTKGAPKQPRVGDIPSPSPPGAAALATLWLWYGTMPSVVGGVASSALMGTVGARGTLLSAALIAAFGGAVVFGCGVAGLWRRPSI